MSFPRYDSLTNIIAFNDIEIHLESASNIANAESADTLYMAKHPAYPLCQES